MRMVDARRLAGDRALIEHDLFGISAAANANHAENLIADLEAGGLGAAFLDDAGSVAPQCIRQAVLFDGWVLAVSDLEIDGIDARSLHTQQNLRGIGKRRFDVICLKDIGAAEAVKARSRVFWSSGHLIMTLATNPPACCLVPRNQLPLPGFSKNSLPEGEIEMAEVARQKRITGRVMHEFKHGELKSGPGGKGGRVKSRRQAVAIALEEAGASKY